MSSSSSSITEPAETERSSHGKRHRRHRRSSSSSGELSLVGLTTRLRYAVGSATSKWGVGQWLDAAVEALLPVLLAFAPLAFGSVEPWSELVVICLASAIALLVAAKFLLARDSTVVRTWAYLPIVLFLGIVLLQLVPLPAGILRLLSPGTVALREQLLGQSGVGGGTLSLYPHATRHDLRLLLVVVAVFFAVVNVYRRPEQIKRLLIAIVVIGSGISLLALAQDLTEATNIYWVGPPGKGNRATAGPFVHYGHYGQFANLTLGATLGLLLVILHKSLRSKASRRPEVPLALPARGWAFVLTLSALITATTILLSGSRAAMSATVAAALFAAACVVRSRGIGRRGWLALPLVAALLGVLLAVGSGAAMERWGTLSSAESYKDRVQILSDLTAAWKQFPVLGTGLGTHETLYPMYDRSSRLDLATHAENEYAQVLTETGGVGLLLVLLFAAIVWRHAMRASRHTKPPIRLAAIGLGFGVLAIMIHSLADFGQHLMGDAVPMAVTCGLIISLGRLAKGHRAPEVGSQLADAGAADATVESRAAASNSDSAAAATVRRPGIVSWGLRLASLGVVILAATWAILGAGKSAYAANLSEQATNLRESLAAMTDEGESANEQYAQLLALAGAAADAEPDNVTHRYLLNVARWQSISRVRDAQTGDVVLTQQSKEYAAKIAADLHAARALCPTFGPVYSLCGQIRLFVLNDPAGAADARTAFALSQCDQLAAYLSARLDASEGKWETAAAKLRRHLELSGGFEHVIEVCQLGERYDVAATLAGQNHAHLLSLAARLEAMGPAKAELAQTVRRRATESLAAAAASPAADPGTLAAYAADAAARKEYAPAIDAYRRALAHDYAQPDWHFGLARTLGAAGRYQEALRAAKAGLLLRPTDEEADKLVTELEIAVRGANMTPK